MFVEILTGCDTPLPELHEQVKMVLAADELTVTDPHQLLDDLAESLKLIKDAVVMKSSS